MTTLIVLGVLFGLYMVVMFISHIVLSIGERRDRIRALRAALPQIERIDIDRLRASLRAVEQLYATEFESYRAAIAGSDGRPINLCPLCGAYLTASDDTVQRSVHTGTLRYSYGPRANTQRGAVPSLLRCSRSPLCSFSKPLADASSIIIKS